MQLCQRLSSYEEILGHRQIGTEVHLLIHGGYAHVLGISGRVVPHRTVYPVYMYLPAFEVIDSRQTLYERRFAGTVLPHQSMDLSLSQREIHVVQSLDSGESHRDASCGQHYIVFHVPSPFYCL